MTSVDGNDSDFLQYEDGNREERKRELGILQNIIETSKKTWSS